MIDNNRRYCFLLLLSLSLRLLPRLKLFNSIGTEEWCILLLNEPLARIVDVVIVVLQGQGTSLDIVESREGLKHLVHDWHIEELSFTH